MTRPRKIDNSRLGAKLALRRYFLETYHSAAFNVFDACQGSAVIWSELRREYTCSYWGVDVKHSRGRLTIDSKRVLAQPGWDFDVIDVDTYGSPWGHWEALLPNVTRPVTVFLTVGLIRAAGGGVVRKAFLKAVGLSFRRLRLPPGLGAAVSTELIPLALGLCHRHGLEVVEAAEAVQPLAGPAHRTSPTARYFGVHLRPKLARRGGRASREAGKPLSQAVRHRNVSRSRGPTGVSGRKRKRPEKAS